MWDIIVIAKRLVNKIKPDHYELKLVTENDNVFRQVSSANDFGLEIKNELSFTYRVRKLCKKLL